MDRANVKSSLLKSIAYNPETRVLEVEFNPKKGKTAGNIYQ